MTDRTEALGRMIEGFHGIRQRLVRHPEGSVHRARLSLGQWRALEVIGREGPLSIKDLKTALQVSSSAATQMVNELVKSGSVVRTRDSHDARATQVALSPRARRDLRAMRKVVLARLEKMFSVLSEKEFALYMQLTEKVIRAPRP